MSSGGGGGTQVVEQNSDPWERSQPFLTDVMSNAQNLYRSGAGQQYAPFSTVTPMHGATTAGLNTARDIAQGGNPFTQPSQQAMTSIMRGGSSLGNMFANNGSSPANYLINPMQSIAQGANRTNTSDPRWNAGPNQAERAGVASMGAAASRAGQTNPYESMAASQGFAGNPALAGLGGLAGARGTFANQNLGGMAGGMASGAMMQAMNPMARAAAGGANIGIDPRLRAGQSAAEQMGFGALGQIAQQGSGTGGYEGMMTSTALSQNPNMGRLSQFSQQMPTASSAYLQGMASGDQDNPYADRMFDRQAKSIRDNVNSMFARAGRYGSAAQQDLMAENIGDAAANFYGNIYNQDRNRQLQAAGQIDSATQAARGQAAGVAGQMAGLSEQGFNRALSGLQGAAGLGSQNTSQRMAAAQSLVQGGQGARQLGASQAQALSGIQNQNVQNQLQAAGQLQGADATLRQQQLAATGQMDAAQQAELNRQLASLSQYGSLSEAGANRGMQGIQLGSDIRAQDIGQLGSLGQQMANTGMSSRQLGLDQASGLSGALNQNIQNQMAASQGLQQYDLNRQQQQLAAAGMSPALRQAQYTDANQLLGVGQRFEDQARMQTQDALNRWNFSQQAPWDALGRYSGLVSGMGNLGGTMTSTQPGQSTNPVLGALGGAATGAGALSALGGLGIAAGPLAPFVIGAGALGGLLG